MSISPAVIWAVVAMIVATIAGVTVIIVTARNPAPLLALITVVVVPTIAQLVTLGKVSNKVDAVHQDIHGEDSNKS